MKNKISINRKAFAFTCVLLVAVIFCGCGNSHQTKEERNWQGFEVIVVDSCEYINQFEGGHSGYRFTHKGNCKFCAERSKK